MSAEQLPKNAALIIVDVQDGFDDPVWGKRNNPDAEENIQRLLEGWRATGRPIFHICHRSKLETSPLHPSSVGFRIKDIVRPLQSEPVIEKQVNSAFIGTDLESRLRTQGIRTLIITGLTTDHCVSTTARMASNLGFETYVVGDATATFDRTGPDGAHYDAEEIHAVNLASLNEEFAIVRMTEEVLRKVK